MKHKAEQMAAVITRFAPSPTGALHIGSARTALFNFLYARQHEGTFIVRIEDTDTTRSKPQYETDIVDGLLALGITADHFYRQSERGEIYAAYIQKLLDSDAAYVSKETPREGGDHCEVIRFRNPGRDVSFTDVIRGEITQNTSDLGDFVIARDARSPLYHLAVVVDDYESAVTHVIRGEDHIANTPRQLLIQEAIGASRPIYAHLPLILAPDRSKLSKRHGAVSVSEYLREGYLPDALANFIALLGWSPQHEGASDASEIFSTEDLLRDFRLEQVHKSGAIFNVERLNWINREYMRRMNPDECASHIAEALPASVRTLPDFSINRVRAMIPLVLDRISHFGELGEIANEFSYFFERPKYEGALLAGKDGSISTETINRHFVAIRDLLSRLPDESFSADAVKSSLWDYATAEGRGDVLWPLRVSLSGRERSADPFTIAAVIGKEETISRIDHALRAL